MERSHLLSINVSEIMGVRKVLVVEKDITLQNFWISVFEEFPLSFEIDWASSVEEFETAIRRAKAQGGIYDFIICDIFLSGKRTGIDLWREYRESSEYFVLTSSISPRKYDEMLARDAGLRPMLLAQPLDPRVCAETIDYLLHYSRKNRDERIQA